RPHLERGNHNLEHRDDPQQGSGGMARVVHSVDLSGPRDWSLFVGPFAALAEAIPLTTSRRLVDASAYYERPVAIVSSSSSAGTQQHVAYPSFPSGGFRVMFQVRSGYEDALTAAREIQGRFTNQGVAVLEGSMLGLGKFLVTPVG